MFKHTLDAPAMAAAACVPVVMSIHDHYTLCPTIHLLDDIGALLRRDLHARPRRLPDAGPGRDGCRRSSTRSCTSGARRWSAALRDVDAFVTTSRHAREVHRRELCGDA